MTRSRREFLHKSALVSSALLVGGQTASCAESKTQEIDIDSKVESLFKKVNPISNEERLDRIARAQTLMKDNNVEAVYLESGTSLDYFTGIKWWPSERMTAVIIPKEGDLVYISPAFEEERLGELINIKGQVRTWDEHESPYELVVNTFKDLNIKSGEIGMEENVRFFLYDGIKNVSTNLKFVNAKSIVGGCRSIKSSAELKLMEMANKITLEAYRIGFSQLTEGMSQYDFNAIVYKAFTDLGATETGWAGSSFGKYSAFPHGSSQAQSLKKGDIVLIDGGCKLHGYQADITRTTVFGEPTPKQKQVWGIVKDAQTAVYEAIEVGKPCEHLDSTARQVVESAGFGSGYANFFHRVGHGIGMDFHEWEYLVKENQTPLTPGMCFSNEPGIYLYNEFGIRIEDCFYVTENGYEAFTPQSPSIEVPI